MAKSDTTQDLELAREAVAGNAPRKSSVRRLRRRLSELAARISACALGIAVASMVTAQNVYGQTGGGRFQAAPKAPEAEAAASDMILGFPVNTLFFVAAGVIAVFWFTLGGGRKPKVTRH